MRRKLSDAMKIAISFLLAAVLFWAGDVIASMGPPVVWQPYPETETEQQQLPGLKQCNYIEKMCEISTQVGGLMPCDGAGMASEAMEADTVQEPQEEPGSRETGAETAQEQAEDPDPALEILTDNGYREEIPLPYNLQIALYKACQQTGCDYALALACIEQETDFQNVRGDSGAAYGYMQVHPRWHRDRMIKYGVTDLMDPMSNFLVGTDYLAECVEKRGYYQQALTVYNTGHWPGSNNGYSREAMSHYYKWQKIVG